MRIFIAAVLWFLLFAVSWPLALAVIFLFPVIWLLLLPFRLIGFAVGLSFSVVKEIVLFPFRLGSALFR
jgi:hypothetical protein